MVKPRISKLKKTKRVKFLIATMGPGETIQGIALYKYLLKKGADVAFSMRMKMNYVFFKNQGQKVRLYMAETPELFTNAFEKEKPDVLVLCNSKIVTYYKDFFQNPPLPKPVTVTLDSNWLFLKNEPWYSFAEWADKYLIVFPKKIFNSGLKKYGGNYDIPDREMKKIEIAGFIPSFKKIPAKERLKIRKLYGIKKDEKIIFSYFGGFGAGFRPWALDNLMVSTARLIGKGHKIKIIYACRKANVKNIEEKSWMIRKKSLSDKDFFSILSSADLVFQHQGLGTLAQAISARIPAIANVRDIQDEPYARHAHAWEIDPFVKAHVCRMFYRSTPIEDIENGIEELLYNKKEINKMKTAQKKCYIPGEPAAYKIIKKLLKA